MERARDNHIPQKIVESVTKRPDSHNGGWNYFYPGHGAWSTEKRNQGNLLHRHKANRKHCKNVQRHSDLFICEGMYAEKDKIAKAKQYKHMTFYEAADMAKRAGVEEMWLTQFFTIFSFHAEDYMPEVKKIFPNAYLGKDGKSVELLFDENE